MDKHGIEGLMTAAVNLSKFAMVTTKPKAVSEKFVHQSIDSKHSSKWPNEPSVIDRYNWLLHIMYARGQYDEIEQFIRSEMLHKNIYMTYIQGLVHRENGRLTESLDDFQMCIYFHPKVMYIKQVAKTLSLLGRYHAAIEAYKEALSRSTDEWELFYNIGLCYMKLNELKEAKQYLLQALQISDIHDEIYMALGNIYILKGELNEADVIFHRGARCNPESPEISTRIGLLAFEKGNYTKAFEYFGRALTFDPTHIPAIMAACQVIQKHADIDVALSKYRIVYGLKPECAQVWNNIGMCFFSKRKFVAAISCLKRANYLAPFEFYILYNLALVHLHLQQNASAVVYLQSALRANKQHAPTYALLGVTLSKLNDLDNALKAYTYSLKLDPTEPMTLLNFAIFQLKTGVSNIDINKTLIEFYQHYAERTKSIERNELDASMVDIAEKVKQQINFSS